MWVPTPKRFRISLGPLERMDVDLQNSTTWERGFKLYKSEISFAYFVGVLLRHSLTHPLVYSKHWARLLFFFLHFILTPRAIANAMMTFETLFSCTTVYQLRSYRESTYYLKLFSHEINHWKAEVSQMTSIINTSLQF